MWVNIGKHESTRVNVCKEVVDIGKHELTLENIGKDARVNRDKHR